jgi:hypothetical protein
MKEVVRARFAEVEVSIKQGTNKIHLMFETREAYDNFAMAFNEAYGFGWCAIMEAEFHHFMGPVSALPEEEE